MLLKQNRLNVVGILAMTVLLASACTLSYPADDYQTKTGSGTSSSARPLTVYISGQEYFSFATTRGTGAFSDDRDDANYINKLKNSDFYVYAFRTHYYAQGNYPDELMAEVDYSRYFKASQNTGDAVADPHNYHCLVDGKDYFRGLPMRVTSDLKKLDYNHSVYGDLKFNFAYPTLGYNFFGYFVDGLDINQMTPHRDADRIYYTDFAIDGTQDILCGTAPKISTTILDQFNVPDKERQKIRETDGYSHFAASCGLYPQIPMNHQLARLKFYAVAGKKNAEGVAIKSIAIHSRYKGEFTVATRDPEKYPQGIVWTNDTKLLPLCEASADGVAQCQPLNQDGRYTMHWQSSFDNVEWQKRLSVEKGALQIGGSLLVAPGREYLLELEYIMDVNDTYGTDNTKTITQALTMSNSAIFEAGKEYPVYIGVFGPEEIWIGVDITGWTPSDDPVNIEN